MTTAMEGVAEFAAVAVADMVAAGAAAMIGTIEIADTESTVGGFEVTYHGWGLVFPTGLLLHRTNRFLQTSQSDYFVARNIIAGPR